MRIHVPHPRRQFADRVDAGRALAARLGHLRGRDVIVLALPRGGVPVGYEIAHTLGAPLDVLNVRKLGVPRHEELAMGAVATGGVRVLNDDVIRSAGVSAADVEAATARERRELERRERAYRGGRPSPPLAGRTVVLVDDGIATGATARAAIAAIRAQRPERLVLAVPVAQASTVEEFAREVDEVVCALAPDALLAIGLWYDDFSQVTDDEVRSALARGAQWYAATPPAMPPATPAAAPPGGPPPAEAPTPAG
jgi:predicted phosphoribosyltransferase